MRGLNRVSIIGNLGADPDIRFTRNGTAVANLSVAVNEQWKNRDGERQERTEWVRCVLWDKLAEVAKNYLHKGDAAYLEGRMQTRKWEDRNGSTKYTTEVQVSELRMLGNGARRQVDEPSHPDDQPAGDEAGSATDDDVPF